MWNQERLDYCLCHIASRPSFKASLPYYLNYQPYQTPHGRFIHKNMITQDIQRHHYLAYCSRWLGGKTPYPSPSVMVVHHWSVHKQPTPTLQLMLQATDGCWEMILKCIRGCSAGLFPKMPWIGSFL